MNDLEWFSLYKKSPERGYRALIDQYGNLVYAIVLNKIKNVASREDIDDCVSDIFVEVFQNIDKYSPENGSLKGYLSTISKRRAIDAFRKLSSYGNRMVSMDDETTTAELPHAPDDTESETEAKLARSELWECVKKLGEPDTSIITLQYFYDKSAAEIGVLLKMTAAAVQKRSVRARQKLQKLLGSVSQGGNGYERA